MARCATGQLSAAGQTLLPRDAFQADAAISRRRLLLEGKKLAGGENVYSAQSHPESGTVTLLDEVIGANFAIIAWGCNPQWGLNAGQIAQWRAVGVRFIQVVPEVQIHRQQDNFADVIRVGDTQNRLKSWFAQIPPIAVVRPDRFVAVAIPQTLAKARRAWRARCSWPPADHNND
jgi:3-(3-hydroxy-phenyl)propionate hydroxylase